MFVFGYGSLVSLASVESTLGHPVNPDEFSIATLAGWTRAWNVGSDKQSHPERTFYLEDGSEYRGLTVVLGIEEVAGRECLGAVFPVGAGDLTHLDVRERNYVRVEVTDSVDWVGKPGSCAVYAYAPTQVAISRIADYRRSGQKINVRKGYVDLTEKAFEAIGQLDVYRATTPEIPFDVSWMRTEFRCPRFVRPV